MASPSNFHNFSLLTCVSNTLFLLHPRDKELCVSMGCSCFSLSFPCVSSSISCPQAWRRVPRLTSQTHVSAQQNCSDRILATNAELSTGVRSGLGPANGVLWSQRYLLVVPPKETHALVKKMRKLGHVTLRNAD